MAPTLFIGIDPGKAGGIVFLGEDDYVKVIEMPHTEKDILEALRNGHRNSFALIEKVHAMPKQGVTSSFTFGMGYGGLRMALVANKISFNEVTPQKWQKELGIVPRKKDEGKPDFKKRLRAKAQQLFPEVEVNLKTCDALLIALYAKLVLGDK